MNHTLFGLSAGLLAAAALVPYIASILRGHTRPSRSAYFVKALVAALLLSSYIAAGGGPAAWLVGTLAVSAIVIFVLSLAYGVGRLDPIDLTCLVAALGAIALWRMTGDATTALYATIAIRAACAALVLRKLHRHPGTEDLASWAITGVAEIVNLGALTSLAPKIALLPITDLLYTAAVLALILHQRRRGLRPGPSTPAWGRAAPWRRLHAQHRPSMQLAFA